MYEKRAVLFLDILGFKQLIQDKKEDLILSALEVPQHLQNQSPFDGKTEMKISAFSDSIAVSEVIKEDHIGVIRMMGYASYLWWKFFAKGVLTRGGIAVGDLRHKDGIIFGPAMNEAYELESQVANYPRIALSEDVRDRLIREVGSEYGHNASMLQFGLDIMRRDFDGVDHVHVLGPAGSCPAELQPHKDADPITGGKSFTSVELNQAKWATVTEFLEHRPTSRRVASKYDWLSNYLTITKAKY
ncbi:MAG: hypothetical protein V4646_19530 [Pseudomonadota bacterium]